MTANQQTFNPYVGPRPFERQEENIFFGRDREVSELLDSPQLAQAVNNLVVSNAKDPGGNL